MYMKPYVYVYKSHIYVYILSFPIEQVKKLIGRLNNFPEAFELSEVAGFDSRLALASMLLLTVKMQQNVFSFIGLGAHLSPLYFSIISKVSTVSMTYCCKLLLP